MPYLNKEALCPEPIDCKILTAALDLFVENGYHNVSIHEVQKQAEVSIGSIYNHFGGKEGIAKALYRHILNEIDELIDRVIDKVDSPSEQCKEIITQLFEHTETHRNIIAFVFHTKHAEFLPQEPLICDASPFKRMREIITQGIVAGEFKKMDSWVASSIIFGSAVRMIQLRLDNHIENPLTEYTSMVIDAAWVGLGKEQLTKEQKASSYVEPTLVSKAS